jgi:DNA-binding SARP family transcriptional activator
MCADPAQIPHRYGGSVEFRVLGPLEVLRDGRPVALGGVRPRAILAGLLLRANVTVAVDELARGVWEELPRAAGSNVRSYVAQLRAAFATAGEPANRLVTGPAGYRLVVAPGELDLAEFEALVQDADAVAGTEPVAAAERLRAALRLWHGDALAGLPVGPLLDAEASRLDQRRLTTTERWAELALAAGRPDEVADELAGQVRLHPLRERFWLYLMRALHQSGRQAAALQAYRNAYEILDRELGVQPGAPLQQLHQEILTTGPAAPASTRTAQPRQLPADVAGFTGRVEYLRRLDDLVPGTRDGATVAIATVTGMAGVGKTALAVHWAHRVRDRFPDGQLYVNLRGFADPPGSAMTPAEAIRGFLDGLGVPPERIPADASARTGLYRSLLAERRVLVVLDNAGDAAQVRPLLPGGPGCLTVVTSRNHLAGLVAAEGARPLAVQLPTVTEARAMLAGRLGRHRVTAELAAVDGIVTRCGRLPLALAIAAARAAMNPDLPLDAIAAQLHAARDGLDLFAGEDPATDVRAVFSWSYRSLRPPAARLFRLLGVHPGPDITAPAAASLAGVPPDGVRPLLTALTEAHLLAEHAPGRYALHDLLRVYAGEIVAAEEPEAERLAAVDRYVSHYVHTAYPAARALLPILEPVDVAALPPGVTPERPDTDQAALAWFTAEHPVLLAAIRQAAEHGFDQRAGQLARAVSDFLQRQGHWYDLAVAQRIALAAAQRTGDVAAQGDAHRNLGAAHARLGHRDTAVAELHQALDRYRAVGDHLGQGKTHLGLGFVLEQDGRYREAQDQARLALDRFRAAGDRTGLARALNSFGWCHSLLGDHRTALDHCRDALALQREGDDRRGMAYTLDSLGYIHHQLGEYPAAIACYEEAIDLLRAADDRYYQADALHHLGDTHRALDQADAACAAWRRALAILDQLHHPDADTIRAKLRDTGGRVPRVDHVQ